MEKQDKTMVETWVISVGRVARDLLAEAEVNRDKEMARWLGRLGGDLQYTVDDILDTVKRL